MKTSIEIVLGRRSKKIMLAASIALLILGVIGIAFPQIMSLTVTGFIGWLLVLAGIAAVYLMWHGYRSSWAAWLKPLAMLLVGLSILIFPQASAATLGLLLAFYFLTDGFSGIAFAFHSQLENHWGWMLVNGVVSVLLGMVFLLGWPISSVWLVGLFVGISLFIDGAILLMIVLSTEALG